MKVSQIFTSVQGEGVLAGVPTIFFRLQGCDLGCSYCDTQYAQSSVEGQNMHVFEAAVEIAKQSDKVDWVCITGGEPLLQEGEVGQLVQALKAATFKIEIETNGTQPLPLWWRKVDCWCPDIKCPSSGVTGRHREDWFQLREGDQIKFVVGTEADLHFASNIIATHKTPSTYLISPIIRTLPLGERRDYHVSGTWLQRCAEFCKEHNTRLSLQLHKFIWEPDRRDV